MRPCDGPGLRRHTVTRRPAIPSDYYPWERYWCSSRWFFGRHGLVDDSVVVKGFGDGTFMQEDLEGEIRMSSRLAGEKSREGSDSLRQDGPCGLALARILLLGHGKARNKHVCSRAIDGRAGKGFLFFGSRVRVKARVQRYR